MIVSSAAVNTNKYDTSKLEVDNDHGTLSQQDFLELFVTQMQNQDPTEPMDSSEMMQQTATFTEVETMTAMSEDIQELVDVMSNSAGTSQMASASSVIGMIMEYEGNDTTLTESGAAIEFETETIPSKCTVVIRDEDGNFVRSFEPTVSSTDKQYIVWDGTDASGNTMEEGSYKFTVTAYDADGEKIETTTYGNGQVTGVSLESGSLVYEVDGTYEVAAEDVISVRDASLL